MCSSMPCSFWSTIENFLLHFCGDNFRISIISTALIIMMWNLEKNLVFYSTRERDSKDSSVLWDGPSYFCLFLYDTYCMEEVRIYRESRRSMILQTLPLRKISSDHHHVYCIRGLKLEILIIVIMNWKKVRRKAVHTFKVNWSHDNWEYDLLMHTFLMAVVWRHVNSSVQQNIHKMPRESCVPQNEAVKAVERYIIYFDTNDLPKSNANVWKEMSKECCDKKWSPLAWYTNVTEDRREILTTARANQNIEVPFQVADASIDDTVNNSKEEMCCEDAESEFDENSHEFKLPLPPELWNKVKPVKSNKGRTTNTLKPRVWSNVILDQFQREFRLPCAYVLKRADVCISSNREHYLKIVGHCRDKTCANPFLGIADKEPCPITGILDLVIWTRDTYGTIHAPVNRPCNGEKRMEVGKRALAEGPYNARNGMIRETTRRGDPVAPTVPSADVVSHCKQDFARVANGLEKKRDKNPIHVIEELQWEKPYFGTITHVSACPFLVIYMADDQIASFKQYCRINRDNSMISIDSTGSLVRKINRPRGLKSGHIFLFSIVINFSKTILSVCQMISECQEWEPVMLMLGTFIRKAKIKPKRCISDASKALFLAESVAFNGCSTSQYIERLFIAVRTKTLNPKTVDTFLFSDVAHFIHAATRWKIFQNLQLPAVKDFFIRALAMMVDCQRLEDFKKLFFLTCLVCLQSHEDSQVPSPYAKTVQDARLQLQHFMAERPMDTNGFAHFEEMQKLEDYDPEITAEEERDSPQVTGFIDQIIVSARSITCEGTNLNAYCLPGLIKDLRRVGRDFLLWTAVGNPFYMGHHSSSSSEAHFSILKNKVFKQHGLPQRADNFLAIHTRALLGEQLNFDSNLKHFLNQNQYVSSPLAKDPLPKRNNRVADTSPEDRIEKENGPIQKNTPDHILKRKKIIPEDFQKVKSSKRRKTAAEEDVIEQLLSKGKVVMSDSSNDEECMSRENWRGKGEPNFFLNEKQHEESNMDDDWRTKMPGDEKNEESEKRRDVGDCGSGVHADCEGFEIGDSDRMEKEIQENSFEIDSEMLAEDISLFSSSKIEDFLHGKLNSGDFDAGNVINCTTAEDKEFDVKVNKEDFRNVMLDHSYVDIPSPKYSSGAKKSKAKYFRDCPEIKYCDPKVRTTKITPHLLPHAMRCGSVKIDDTEYVVRNTCAFDSLVQIVYTAALDNGTYRSFLEESVSPLSQFVLNFTSKGACKEIYSERARLLRPLFPPQLNENSPFVFTIDAHGNPLRSWRSLMTEDPSIMRNINCSNPGCEVEKQRKFFSWFPNIASVKRYGFAHLQKALEYYPNLWNVKCSCGGSRHEENISNFHIYLELDVRVSDTDPVKTVKLNDIPKTVVFNQEYRLAGIVAYDAKSDHYTAYCCRRPGVKGSVSACWEHHNGIDSKVKAVRGNPNIQPECAIYILVPNTL